MADTVESTFKSLPGNNGAGSDEKNSGGLVRSLIAKILRMKDLRAIYNRANESGNPEQFSNRVLKELDVTYEIAGQDKCRIPQNGPLIIVANHPYGAIEGLVLDSILQTIRPDTRIMANFLIATLGLGGLSNSFILVDPFERKESLKANLRPLREAIEWVSSGHALGIFPAGEVSRIDFRNQTIADRPWNDVSARIVRKTKATVVPVYFEGGNGPLFHVLGLLHPLFRALLLPRQMLNKKGHKIVAQVGSPISYERLSKLENHEITSYLRLRTYNLKNRLIAKRKGLKKLSIVPAQKTVKYRQPIVNAKPTDSVVKEIRDLPPEHLLISSKDFDVFSATADQIPNTMHEIGRLREITFRGAGEGTGNGIDIDSFDSYYQHLVLWNRERREVVGAYRLGRTDAIIKSHGMSGLYTNSLFDYKEGLFARVRPALEVGRSFVRPEYQKNYQPLLLLWSGIGRFLAKNIRYRFLFGAVSISNEYHGISRQLILRCLKECYTRPDLARFVRPRHPAAEWSLAKKRLVRGYSMLNDINDVSEVVSDIEKDSKGIPILLKHYMKLGGQFLGFGQDPQFSNAIDALVLVDLIRTDRKILGRYMGQAGVESYLQFHSIDSALEVESAC